MVFSLAFLMVSSMDEKRVFSLEESMAYPKASS